MKNWGLYVKNFREKKRFFKRKNSNSVTYEIELTDRGIEKIKHEIDNIFTIDNFIRWLNKDVTGIFTKTEEIYIYEVLWPFFRRTDEFHSLDKFVFTIMKVEHEDIVGYLQTVRLTVFNLSPSVYMSNGHHKPTKPERREYIIPVSSYMKFDGLELNKEYEIVHYTDDCELFLMDSCYDCDELREKTIDVGSDDFK